MRKLRLALLLAAVAVLLSARARADSTTTSLAASDFTLALARVDSSGHTTALTTDELATYFSAARCSCPTGVVVGLALTNTAADISGHTLDAQLVVGNDCDTVTSTSCPSVGSAITLSSAKLSTTQSLQTSSIFTAAGQSSCGTSTSSTRLWAIVRLDGSRLASEPSLAITLGGAGPAAPTAVKAVPASEGLLVSWTATSDASALRGHQVLCSPGPATPRAASWETCGTSTTDGGGPFASLDAQFVCSDLVAAGTNSVRVHGLENGKTYQVAVVAVGIDDTPSAPSAVASGTPAPTYGFADVYQRDGGTGQAGCAVGEGGSATWGVVATLAALAVFSARRRRRPLRGAALLAFAAASGLWTSAARADSSELPLSLTAASGDAPDVASPHRWDLELRFGPYRPDVDDEFAERGSPARPYEEVFGSSRRLMMQLEVDRQLVKLAGGTWALGLGAGYMRAKGAALAADLTTASGDETALRLIPLSAALVYRAEALHDRFGSPLVPYAKLGLDCTLWQMSDSSQPSRDGRTFGWHAAAGVALDLSFLDPESAREMDRESGVNGAAVFFEVARYDLDGFGGGSALHVGDTTWFAGLKLGL
jgi:MYXO-CTERM domain-containing protein